MSIELRKQLNQDMLVLIGKQEILEAVSDAMSKVNELYDQFNNITLNWLPDGEVQKLVGNHQAQGRYIESAFARNRNINGFLFYQGNEHKNEKDAECYEIPNFLDERYNTILGDVHNPHNYGIELKTTSTPTVSGNKHHAQDSKISKRSIKPNKDSFHIFITRIKSGIKTQHLEITEYKVYFGFIKREDWEYGESGGFSHVKKEILTSMIELK